MMASAKITFESVIDMLLNDGWEMSIIATAGRVETHIHRGDYHRHAIDESFTQALMWWGKLPKQVPADVSAEGASWAMEG